MLNQLARVSVDILLLRRGPQELPCSWGLLAGLAFAYCSLTFMQVSLVAKIAPAITQAVLATFILVAFVNAVLRMRGSPDRFVQTLTAFFLVGSILTVLMLGPTSALAPFLNALAANPDAQTAPQPPAVALLAYMVLGFWSLVVFGHIYRHALDVSLWMGIGAALLFEFTLFMTFALLGAGG